MVDLVCRDASEACDVTAGNVLTVWIDTNSQHCCECICTVGGVDGVFHRNVNNVIVYMLNNCDETMC